MAASAQQPARRRAPPVPTRAEALAQRLADEIVSGRLTPGTPLEEVPLAAAHGVSRTPVREALRRLESSGLVETRPRRGAVVARPQPQRLREMFAVMAELEALAAAACARAMKPGDRRELEALHRRMAAMVREPDIAGYRAANVAFHQALYAGARNGYLAELAADTRRRLAPFRAAQLEAPDRLRRSHEEHGGILTAIQRGEAEEAARLVREHLALTEAAWGRMMSLALGSDEPVPPIR
ncbi:GntR family transcriptional regulator [Falsiroseomonas oryzae]|uniref:GntR family transcriptional regulator n=1 Tax=Falsiroseomonas oryzae TaxID=2766473 RepID=UPI0022EB2D19|nr:GntR family transcriptional regulator [Roseomonas sp. MO-31]